MLPTHSRPIDISRFLQPVIVTSILVTLASPTAAQAPLLQLDVMEGTVLANLDFAPRFAPQGDGDSIVGSGPVELIEATVQDGDLSSTGVRSHARASTATMTTNAQFVIDGDLPVGSANSSADIRFDAINNSTIPHEVFLDFFLPPALMEFSNNVESAGIAAFEDIQTGVTARICRNECHSGFREVLFEFEATLSERYVPAANDPARIDYDLLVDVSASNPQLDLASLRTPTVVEDPQPGSNSVTVNFPDFLGTVRLAELAANGGHEVFNYEMSAFVLGGGVASGIGPVSAIAAINDPVGIGPIVSIRSVPIPEPSSCLLLALGTVVLGVYRS